MFDSNAIFAIGAYTLAAFNIADCTSILQVGGTLAGTSLLIYGWFNAQRRLSRQRPLTLALKKSPSQKPGNNPILNLLLANARGRVMRAV